MSSSHSFHSFSARRPSVVCHRVCSPFLFCLLLLFLIFASTPFTSSPGHPSYFSLPISWITAVSAAPLRPSAFPQPLQTAAACDVCNHMIMNLVVMVARAVELQNRTIVTELDVEPFVDHLCDSNNVGGVWLRRVGFFVVPDDANNRHSPVHFELRVLKDYTKCKRGCVTAQAICHALIDSPNFDGVFKRLPVLSQQSSLVFDENAVNMLRATVCYGFAVCHDKKKHVASLNNLLNTPENHIREELEKETIEWVTPEALDAELTAYATQVKYSVDSFSKEDIRELHAALAEKDREAASAMNKKIDSLTTEEFVKLRSLAFEERKEMEEAAKKIQLEKKKEEYEKQRAEDKQKKKAKEEELRAKREARRERVKQARENGDL